MPTCYICGKDLDGCGIAEMRDHEYRCSPCANRERFDVLCKHDPLFKALAQERDRYRAALLQIAKEDMERFTHSSAALGLLCGPLAEIALEVLPKDLAQEVHAHHKAAFERWKAEEGGA